MVDEKKHISKKEKIEMRRPFQVLCKLKKTDIRFY